MAVTEITGDQKAEEQTPACPICGNARTSYHRRNVSSVYSPEPYQLVRCPACRHIFTTPIPDLEKLSTVYNENYSYDAHYLIRPEKEYRARLYSDYIAQLGQTQRVLEIGCMYGFLLQELKQRGFDVTGVEIDGEAVAYAREHGLNVHHMSLEDYVASADERFDIIVMSHALEHIADPTSQLKLLSSLLNDNGKIVIIVPNANSRTARLFGRYWGYWQVPVHLHHFNENSLSHALAQGGFAPLAKQYFGADSLFFLSTAANLVGGKNEGHTLSPLKRSLVKGSSAALKNWSRVGSEDMLMVGQKIS